MARSLIQVTRAKALAALLLALSAASAARGEDGLRERALAAMRQANDYFTQKVAVRGGYVYHYSLDLQKRWGEGEASATQVWVQPPGTPTVGLAFLKAYEATGEKHYLDAATAAAEALMHGQLKSGGWTNNIDFNPKGRVALYRNGQGGGKNYSSLDDGQTQTALLFMIRADAAHRFKHAAIHEAAEIGLKALLEAQFANGGFPQVWAGPVADQPVKEANYPEYDWRTEGRIKNYWDLYTLNDNVCGYVAQALTEAHTVYKEPKYQTALEKLGDFLVLAQMPEPQTGWAQQYNYAMQPVWARKFEPPGVSGDESQEAIETLLWIHRVTGKAKYLEPIPAGLAFLKKSLLPDGKLARYYELRTNKPLYMRRSGKQYSLTYDDANLPSHYGWKTSSRIEKLAKQYEAQRSGTYKDRAPEVKALAEKARRIVEELDGEGRWVSVSKGEHLVGQFKPAPGTKYLASAVFSENIEALATYLAATKP